MFVLPRHSPTVHQYRCREFEAGQGVFFFHFFFHFFFSLWGLFYLQSESVVWRMSRLTRDGTAEPVSRDQILRREQGHGGIHFSCSADHEESRIGNHARLIMNSSKQSSN